MSKRVKLSSAPISSNVTKQYYLTTASEQEMNEMKTIPKTDAFTQNGANAFSTSGSAVCDLFFALARNCDESRVHNLMAESWLESPLQTCLILLQARDCRDGKGERKVVYHALMWMRKNKFEVYKLFLPFVVQVGSFIDLRKLAGMVVKENKKIERNDLVELKLLVSALKQDQLNFGQETNISLAAKWAPSESKAFDRRFHLAKHTAYLLFGSPDATGLKHSTIMMKYRALIARLRKKIAPIEILLASKQFGKIEYNNQTSKGHLRYKKAFLRNDPERYKEYLASLKKQQEENKDKPVEEKIKLVKINVNTLFPHEILRSLIESHMYASAKPSEEDVTLAETQWTATIEKYKSMQGAFNDAVAVVDVSGSMHQVSMQGGPFPITVSIALGLLTATLCNKGKFANKVITFHTSPSWYNIDPSLSVAKQVAGLFHAPWGGSTNLQKTLMMILEQATTQDDLPKLLFIFSDMQFNEACPDMLNHLRQPNQSLFHTVQNAYELRGLKMPQVVFWNLNSEICLTTPVQQHESGTALLSGYSPAVMKVLLESGLNKEELSPKKVVLKSIEPYAELLNENFKNALL